MRVRLADSLEDARVDALAVPVGAEAEFHAPKAGAVERLVREIVESKEHRGEIGEVLPVPAGDAAPVRRLLLYGVGKPNELDGARLRNAHQFMASAGRRYRYRRLGVLSTPPIDAAAAGGAVEGSILGTWERRSRQTKSDENPGIEELVLVGFGDVPQDEVTRAELLGHATNHARELQNSPANQLTPSGLADVARGIAQEHDLEIEVLGPAELRECGYNLLLAVAQGSAEEPRLIALSHRGGSDGRTLALVGKGITFDSGGISLKPSDGMEKMKADMAGAAAVLSAMEVIGRTRPAANVLGIVATTENMPGGRALRPGDVIASKGVETVEVVNTDAEGRLVLADAMTHAIARGATHIVDLATLTGAVKTALGHVATGAIANDDELWELLQRAAERAGERMWRLPSYDDYKQLLRSPIADIRNSDYGEAGTIMGGLFIGEFVQDRPWVHLDIAATAWNVNADLKTIPAGPSGVGTRTIANLAELFAHQPR